MSKKKSVEIITEAKPHTVKKFELLERYVDEWARKILGYKGKDGINGSKGLIYIDCMSNSGMYHDIKGNLVEGTALRVARRLDDIITNYPGKEAILIFNDSEEERVRYLENIINELCLNNIHVNYYNEDCNDFLRRLNLDRFQKRYNTLLFYDPYKAAIDWDAVTPFLNRWGEVIINHMVYDTSRGAAQAKKSDVINRYQKTYQKDIDYIIEIGNNKDELNKVVMSIINDRRKTGCPEMYIATFPFFNRTNGLLYNLIHCCSSIEGIKLFKKVAWKTFGDKSSLKDTHGLGDQMVLDFNGEPSCINPPDDQCYYVRDIAQYIYDKYHTLGVVKIDTIYNDLDIHPIFPSDGYKNNIKKELKELGVVFRKNGDVEFPRKAF